MGIGSYFLVQGNVDTTPIEKECQCAVDQADKNWGVCEINKHVSISSKKTHGVLSVHKMDCQNVALDRIDFLPNSKYKRFGDALMNASTTGLCRPGCEVGFYS